MHGAQEQQHWPGGVCARNRGWMRALHRDLIKNKIGSIPSGAFNALVNLEILYVLPFCDAPCLVETGAVRCMHPNRQSCGMVC